MDRWILPLSTSLFVLLAPILLLEAASAATPVDQMKPQMRAAYIVGIQEELAAHGYQPGPADGIVSWQTRRAVEQYQRDAGLPVDGVLTKELLDHLKFVQPKVYARAPAQPVSPSAYERDYHTLLIREVQSELSALGYYRGAIDGIAGPRTRAALRQFRADAGLPPEQGVSEATLEQLRAARTGTR